MAKNKYIDYTNDQLENLINEIYAGSISASVLPVDLYHAINSRLLDAVWNGFGGTSASFVDGSADKLLVQYYEHNIAVFSGAKTFQQVKDMSNAVFKPDGYKRDFSDFKKLITGDGFHDGIFRTYNVNWLRTEYDTAFATAQMGRQWNEYVADAETFPLLKYITVHDERVRHDHKAFDGVTLPIGHAFWNTHTPPNGFNCRCRLIQLSEFDEYTITPDGDVKNLPDPDQPLFEFNPGKHGIIFDETKHPYSVKVGERFKVAQSVNFGFPTPPKPVDPLPTPKLPKTIPEIIKSKPANLDAVIKIETDPKFWGLLKESETPVVRKAVGKEGSYATGDSKLVVLNTKRYTTDAGKKSIIYHEFGHVIHNVRGWCKRDGFFGHIIDGNVETIFDKWVQKFDGKKYLDFSYIPKGFSAPDFVDHLNPKKWVHHNWRSAIEKEFPEMLERDFAEFFGSTMDTVESITRGRLGWGHGKKYFRRDQKYSQVAEFMAHTFENKFGGNPVFEKMYPDLYKDMVELMDVLIKNYKNGI
jgi:SPP1 gp7 family putative phage head morphogenesis protein